MDNPQEVSFREISSGRYGSSYSMHSLHSYPAQCLPQIPQYFLNKAIKPRETSVVLDPFCGVGTVLVEAMHHNWNSIGVEINPIASLISKVKATPINQELLSDYFIEISNNYQDINNDEIIVPNFENISYWFNEDAIYELSKIKKCIYKIKDQDVLDFYKVIFSSIIKKTSKTDPRMYVPVKAKNKPEISKDLVWRYFSEKTKSGIASMSDFNSIVSNHSSKTTLINNDIRNTNLLSKDIDMVITSPPYISAQKYVRSTRLEAYWLDVSKQAQLIVNKNTIGTERITSDQYKDLLLTGHPKIDDLISKIYPKNPLRAGITSKYFIDMEQVLKKIYLILNKRGTLVLIIGDNTVTGLKVPTSKFLKDFCTNLGFKTDSVFIDKINSRGLMTKRNPTANLITHEWVFQLSKN